MSNQLWVAQAMYVVGVILVVPLLLNNLRIVPLLSFVQVQSHDPHLVDNTILYHHHEHVLNGELYVPNL